MCRLMGFVSTDNLTLVEAAGPEFTEFAALSARHGDGWGIATNDSERGPQLLLEPTRASESAAFDHAAQTLKSSGVLLHLRWATGSLSVNEGNTHPFSYGDYSFMHNGALDNPEKIAQIIDPKYLALRRGQTDSEIFFYLIMQEIEKYGAVDGIRSAINLVRQSSGYSSINCMMLTPSKLYVVNEHIDERRPASEPADYYDLFYRVDGKEVLVASSGWDQAGWKELPNHSLMVINRSSLEISISDLNG